MNRCWLAVLHGLALACLAGADEVPALRELQVPFDEVRRLLAGSPNAVLLPRAAYDDLREGARLRSRSSNPLQSTVLGSADCTLELREREATFLATLKLAVLADGAQLVPLRATGIDLLAATVDGRPAALWREEEGLFLLVDGKGEHVAELAGLLPVETDAARQTLAFALPEATAVSLRLTAPGDVEVKAGAAVRSHVFDGKADCTRMELVPNRDPMRVVLSRNHRQRQAEAVVEARSVQFASVGEYGESLQATVTLQVPHGSVRELAFALPDGLSITSVTGAEVARWSADQRLLKVTFRDDLTGSCTLAVAGLHTGSPLGDWQFPVLRPQGVIGHSALLGILLDDRLETRGTTEQGLIAVSTALAADRLKLPEAGRQRLVAFLYAPRAEFYLGARIVKPAAAFRVGTNHLLTVADEGLLLSSSFVISPEYERVFAVDVLLPPVWQVAEVRNESGAIPFETHPTAEANRVRVTFPTGAKLGENTGFTVVSRWVPPEWAEDWQERALAFPAVRVAGAREDSGAVAVVGADDFEVGATDLHGLALLDQQERAAYGLQSLKDGMTFRYAQPDYALEVAVHRRTPRVTGETLSFFVVGQENLRCHYELMYRVDRARVRKLVFSLPVATPEALAIRGLAGAAVKEYSPVVQDDRRLWTVWLESPASGQLRLAVDCQMALPNEAEATLPMPTLQGVVYQSGRLAVEGEPDLDVRVTEHPRPVDVGEVAGMAYRPGSRLLGAYGFVEQPGPIRVSLTRHRGCSLPPAAVDRIELTSVFGPSGTGQHLGTYRLRSKLRFLEVALPKGADLWSIQLDGTPLTPLRDDARLLFELPTADGAAQRTLVLVYETPGKPLGLRGRLATPAPELVLRGDGGEAVAVPTADLSWRVYLPFGYRLSGANGTVTAQGEEPVTPGLLQVAGLFSVLSGGIDPRHGLLSGLFLTVQSRSEKSAEMKDYAAENAPNAMAYTGSVAAKEATDVPQDAVPTAAPAPKPSPGSYRRMAQGYYAQAVKGARSLEIALASDGPSLVFRSLGEQPRLAIQVLDGRRLRGICWGVAALVLAIGLYLSTRPGRQQVIYLAGVLVVSGLLPVLPGLTGLALILNYAFYAAFLVLVLDPCIRAWRCRVSRWLGQLVILEARVAAVLLVGLLASAAMAADPVAMEVVKPEPIALPPDALVVPYGEDGQPQGDVLVPRSHYEDLQNRLRPAEPVPPARPYGLGGVGYTGTLGEGDRLVLRGQIEIVVAEDGPVFVPLTLVDAVVAEATLDGKPAALAFAPPTPEAPPVMGLRVTGKGRHMLACEVRLPVTSEGGWRRVKARLPGAGAASVVLRVPSAGTEVVRALAETTRSQLTTKPNEEVKAPLSGVGELSLQWRPQTGVAVADPTLTAESDLVWQVQEDRLWLAWQVKLSFRRGERDRFQFSLPANYVVEEVTGANVRGWETRPDAKGQMVAVTTLKPAALQEEIRLILRRDGLGDTAQAQRIVLPELSVDGAVRHTGRLCIQHSPLLELRLANSDANVRRTEGKETTPAELPSNPSPLASRTFALYELASLPCALELEVSAVSLRSTIHVQSILRLARREHGLESRIEITRLSRPLYELRVALPAALTVKDLQPAVPCEWYVDQAGTTPTLVVLLPDGVTDSFACNLDAQLPEGLGEIPLPRLAVQLPGEQSGEIVVEGDPGLEVEPATASGLERIAMASTHRWLNADQRSLARLAYRYTAPDWSGSCRASRRANEVTAETVTNVRVTDRTVEETSLLSFRIEGGGVRELSFHLPADQVDATIECPLLRHKTVTPDDTGVLVVLALQDEVVGEVMVMVRTDRARSGQELTAQPPTVFGARTTRRLLVAESAGRDEVVVDQQASNGLAPIVRNGEHWAAATRLLGKGAGEAFLVRSDEANPRLALRIERREIVQTAGASIGLASTVLMLDGAGAFRGIQTFHLDNRTEPFLDIELPEGATLWTAEVAGEKVKPVFMDTTTARHVSIPLVKTAEGDLDYTVVLKYGGQTNLPTLGSKQTFPVIRPLNLSPERSLLELRLPRTCNWFAFGGTMGVVDDGGEYQANYLAYKNLQAKRLVEALQSSNPFAQRRAQVNLQKLVSDYSLPSEISWGGEQTETEAVNKEREEGRKVMAQAEKQIADSAAQGNRSAANTDVLKSNFANQAALRADQAVASTKNWGFEAPAKPESKPAEGNREKDKAAKKAEAVDQKANWRQTQNRALVVQQEAQQAVPQEQQTSQYFQMGTSNRSALRTEATGMPLLGRTARHRDNDNDGVSDGDEVILSLVHVDSQPGYLTRSFDLSSRWDTNVDGVQLSVAYAPSQPTGLASLDISLPEPDNDRWRTVRLATPRGDMLVTGHAVSRGVTMALSRLALCLLACGCLALLVLLARRMARSQRPPVRLLLVLSLVSIFFGILPVVGLLLLILTPILVLSAHARRTCRA